MDIVVTDLRKSFGEQSVLNVQSMCFPEGKTSCIMGPSGCGKTTLLHILMGLQTPDSGSVAGVPAGALGAVFQEDRLCENLSAMANLKLVCRHTPEGELKQALLDLGLRDALGKPVRALSGGMCRRVAIARALLSDSACIMMDEPLKGLDRDTKERTAEYIRTKAKGRTLIVITHDQTEVELLNASELFRLS